MRILIALAGHRVSAFDSDETTAIRSRRSRPDDESRAAQAVIFGPARRDVADDLS
jgi:hypothetical protein